MAYQTAPVIEKLTDLHSVEDFDCGEPARNSWLCTRAFSNQKTDDTVTYVIADSKLVIGFYALTVSSIVHAQLSAAMRQNAPNPVGCVLLAQLAVGLPHQGKGLSRDLTLHAMANAVRISELAGCRLFGVHPARPDLEAFYRRFGFSMMKTDPPLMVMAMKKARATLEAVQAAVAPMPATSRVS